MKASNNKYGLVIGGLIWLLFAAFLQAADPSGLINYQGRLLDKYGRRVNTPVEITFRIFNRQDELLWSERHGSIPVSDGIYSTILGSTTPLPASLFNTDEVYFEICINGETLTPRQRITASPYALTARTVNGPVQATEFKMPTGASAGYVLTSDGNGVGRWQAGSGGGTAEVDPIHSSWVNAVFNPTANALWTALDARVLAGTYSVATGSLWTAVGQRVLVADYSAATNELWNAVSARLPLSGGTMTGPLTDNAGFFGRFSGDGSGLTNLVGAEPIWTAASSSVVYANNLANSVESKNYVVTYSGDQNLIAGSIITPYSNIKINTTDDSILLGDPQIQTNGVKEGMVIMIKGAVVTGSVRFIDGRGLSLNCGQSFLLGTNDVINFIYEGGKWSELSRQDW